MQTEAVYTEAAHTEAAHTEAAHTEMGRAEKQPVEDRRAKRSNTRASAPLPASERPPCEIGQPDGAPSSPCATQAGSDVAASEAVTGESWRHWLACGSPREVLARIVHEDPLGVREHVALSLRDGAWLLDADRVLLRAFALIARHALRYRGKPDVDTWIRALADEAVASILREDAEGERRARVDRPTASSARVAETSPDPEAGAEQGAAFEALARPLGLEPRAMGRACLAFNRLPQAERRAFHALVIAGRTLDEVARESGEGATDVARRARRALDAILVGASAGSVLAGSVLAGSVLAGSALTGSALASGVPASGVSTATGNSERKGRKS